MQSVKMKGRTVEEAIEAALEVLKVKREEVEIKVIDEGESGVLGVFGGRMAEIEAFVKQNEEERSKSLLQEILDRMGFLALVDVKGKEEDKTVLNIRGEDLGRIIGKEGATLNALQYLANIILSKEFGRRVSTLLDAAGYRDKRLKQIKKLAHEAADEAITDNREVSLPPMNANERRLVHLEIQGRSDVTSYSRGEGGLRKVIIAPKGQTSSEKGSE